jgi:protein-glutamine gamma-glutamyltransferase
VIRWATLAVLLVVGTFAGLAPHPAPGLVLAGLVLASFVIPWRISASAPLEVVLCVVVGAACIAALAPFLPSPPAVTVGVLRNGWARLAVFALGVAVTRLYFERPVGGGPATVGVALIGLTACGGTDSGWMFPMVAAGFLGLGLAARRASDAGGPRLSGLPRRYPAAALVVLGASVGSALAAAALLPKLHEWSIHNLIRLAGPRARTGFTDRLWLGSLRGMLQSDEIVLRLRGGHADHLRGVAYGAYRDGRWWREADAARVRSLPSRPAGVAGEIRMEYVGREPEAYFLPLGATVLALESGEAVFDGSGVARPAPARIATQLWFRDDRGAAHRLDPPSPQELDVPATLAPGLAEIGRAWTRDAGTPAAQLAALERRLQSEFTYALDFERPRSEEPVLHFLQSDRRGHCEYFASAMALLARSLGLPARVVGGYRVTEHNAVGGYFVVRERNAHTWVEAYVPGAGWQTYDPTPPGALLGASTRETPLLAGLLDAARSLMDAALRWLDALTWAELLTPLGAVAGLYAFLLWRRSRQGRRAARPPESDPALPCLERLTRSLAARGVARPPSEPVECFAARVATDPALSDLGPPASELLLRYSALRYGGIGAEAELDRDVTRVVEGLGRG